MEAKRLLYSNVESTCHRVKTLIVRSRQGGYVTRNCLKCGHPDYINETQLPRLSCDRCGDTLRIAMIEKNYNYTCEQCGIWWRVADQVPHWSDLFGYAGIATSPNRS